MTETDRQAIVAAVWKDLYEATHIPAADAKIEISWTAVISRPAP